MKNTVIALLTAAGVAAGAREVSLINNSNFARGLLHWHYTGKAKASIVKKAASFSNGTLSHYFDLGNLEHADPQCAMPANRTFRFRVRAKGEGTIRLHVRARQMLAGNAVEFATLSSPEYSLTKDFKEYDFEASEPSRFTVFHDKISIECSGKVSVNATSFYYLDKKAHPLVFYPEAAVVRPGDTVKVTIATGVPNQKLTCDLYCGQTRLAGYAAPEREEITTGKDGSVEYTFKVSNAASDGMRLSVSNPETGVKKSFFATIVPEVQLARFREYGKKISGKKHILFLGDSLTDYDRGRNYSSIVGTFIPEAWSFRNAGVGGDTLPRVYARLTGGKVNRPEMYENLFAPMPDMIFLLCGGNDTKVTFSSNYKKNYTPVTTQRPLMEKIVQELKKRAPNAKIVLVTPLDSYLPYQKSLTETMAAQKINHNLFGLPGPIADYSEKLRLTAKKYQTGFLDAGKVFRNAEDLQELNVEDDGVHLSLKGHQLMAEIVLKHLSEMK